MQVDYIIVGQGLAGSFLSWNLLGRGKKVLVIDEDRPFTASRVSSGVINPVTGRRKVRSWMIDELMPFAVDAYTRLGNQLGKTLITRRDIIDFHTTPDMKLHFGEQVPVESQYLALPADEQVWQAHFRYPFGFGEIRPAWVVNLYDLLPLWREQLAAGNCLLAEKFSLERAIITGENISYGDYTARKIIFCEGVEGAGNPYFRQLPYGRNKGQALIVEIPGLPDTHIFKQGMTIVPWQNGLFWVGSSYEWQFQDTSPTLDFREKAEAFLKQTVKHPCRVIDHIAGERPATLERRPFVGLHPLMPSVGILNGLGTKGCTLAPYFAAQLTEHLLNNAAIEPLADVKRFSKILSR